MTGEKVAVSTFCSVYNIDVQFINDLENVGLVTIFNYNQESFIDHEQLHELEMFTKWKELGINAEGIDALYHAVMRLKTLQAELNQLREKLKWYEEGETGMEI